MAPLANRNEPTGRLRRAIVLSATEDVCTVFAQDQRTDVPYAPPFPKPRAERVAPGHLVAIATAPDGAELVVWRWFDAVVLDGAGPAVSHAEDAEVELDEVEKFFTDLGLWESPL